MGIYVACSCGQAFSARPDLAGQTLNCPACGQPIFIPRPQATTGLTPLPAGSYVIPNPTVIRPAAALPATSAGFPDPLKAAIREKLAGEGMSPVVFFTSIAAGSVLTVLLVIIGVQQIVSRLPSSPPGEFASRQPSPPAPVVVTTQNPAPPAVAYGGRSGWTRVTVAGQAASVEFPSTLYDTVSRQREGIVTEGFSWPSGTQQKLVLAHFKGIKVAEAASDLSKFASLTGSLSPASRPREIQVQGYNAIEVVKDDFGSYSRHQFIFIAADEMILISGSAWRPSERSDADYFVNSLQISKPAGLQSLLPKIRWPTFDSSTGN